MQYLQKKYWLLPIVFFISLLPLAGSLVQHYTDEWHYIDSVLLMMQNHDFITPHTFNISSDMIEPLRFKKPIITYWVILGSFKLFGIQVWSFRILFLIAGTFLLALTGFMAQTLYRNPIRSGLTILILMTQLQFIQASIRAIPDVLLVLFMTLSAFGVFLILNSSSYRKTALWMFYLGAAFAIETKGLLGLVFTIYSWIFLSIYRTQIWKEQRLTHVVTLILFSIIAASWYLFEWTHYHQSFSQQFLGDQFKVAQSHWLPLFHLPLTIFEWLAWLLPWSLIAALTVWRWLDLKKIFFQPTELFVLGWTLCTIIIMTCAKNISPRYLLPLMPLWAMVISGIITQAHEPWLYKISRYLLKLLLFFWILVGGVYSLIGAQLLGLYAGIILLLIFLVSFLWIINLKNLTSYTQLTLSAGLMFFLSISIYLPMSWMGMPNEPQQIVNSLLSKNSPIDSAYFVGWNRVASNIRLVSQHQIQLNFLGESISAIPQTKYLPLIIPAKNARKLHLPQPNQKKTVIAKSLGQALGVSTLLTAMIHWKLKQELQAAKTEEYWLIDSR